MSPTREDPTDKVTRLTGGEALVAALVDHGVDQVFGIPGAPTTWRSTPTWSVTALRTSHRATSRALGMRPTATPASAGASGCA